MGDWLMEFSFVFGILGNVISFLIYLFPLRTFYQIYENKSTERFPSEPYVVGLFSSMLWLYYAFTKTDAVLIITINSFGCVIHTIYIILYLIYAQKNDRIFAALLILLLDVGVFFFIVFLTLLLTKGTTRVAVLGWISMSSALGVLVLPLRTMTRVIRTKSVECMPLPLSILLTGSAVVWFFYGHFTVDVYVKLPNILGFWFGVIQIALYFIYKGDNKASVHPAQFERKTSDEENGDAKGDVKLNEESNGSNKGRKGEEVEIELSAV